VGPKGNVGVTSKLSDDVGSMEGNSDSMTLGTWLGQRVGQLVGMIDGMLDGSADEDAVGNKDCNSVGI
jgi:hypothetical protein